MKMKDNPIVYLTQKMWQCSKNNRKNVAVYSIMFLFANLIELSPPLIMAALVNELQKNALVTHDNFGYLILLLSLLVAVSLAVSAFHYPARLIENKNAFLAKVNYKKYLLGGVLEMPLEWHANHHSGDTIDKVEKGAREIKNYASETFRIIGMIIRLAGAFVILSIFDIGAGLIVLAAIILTLWLIARFDKKLVAQYKSLNKAENQISEKVVDVITNVTTVVILRVKKLLLKWITNRMIEPLELYLQNNRLNELKWFLVSFIIQIMAFLVLAYHLYSRFVFGLPILIGTFGALYAYTNRVADAFFNFAGLYGEILKERAAVANSEELAFQFKQDGGESNGNGEFAWKELAIKSLNFSYHTEEGADLHLDNVSLSVKRGEKIALIGATGSGKTTLLKVIRELYQPQKVQIYIDGEELQNSFSSISSQITLIPQEPEIFATTILENITLGMEYNTETVKKYTNIACFTDVAERLPKKFDSSIKEKGVNLSGGEKQRLALARGLLACEDKSIMLLDEPTSSIDVATELSIYQNIFRAFPKKAIISSVHRLHLLPMFDRIYFFKNGKIIASGIFDELLQTSAEFKKIWDRYDSMIKKMQNRPR